MENQSVRLHVLESSVDLGHSFVPIVFVPGMLGLAEHYLEEMAALTPRRCVAMSLRGRGKSESPETGYSFEDHVADIEAVIGAIGLSDFCLLGYSMGVPYAIGYASRHPDSLAGLILCEYPARYPAIPPDWVDQVLTSPTLRGRAKPHVIRALQGESTEILLWDSLSQIGCPTLVLRGGQPDSQLHAEEAEMYREHLRGATITIFEESGHQLRDPDSGRYIDTIKQFLGSLDRVNARPR